MPGRAPPISRMPSGAITVCPLAASTRAAAVALRAITTLRTTPSGVLTGASSA